MKTQKVELLIIGGGPAGLAAAIAAQESGVEEIVIIERAEELGGILQQCIHNGFGLHYFQEELTGPEYANRFIKKVHKQRIAIKTKTTVLEITPQKEVYSVNKSEGLFIYRAQTIILAMGCRERTRGAIGIPGTRPAGIFTAGTAQRYINLDGFLPGKRVLILGSGDIGLIMARRLTLEGAKVLGVLEIMPYSNGLTRNLVQCLKDYDIPLFLQQTILQIAGQERLSGVTIAQVDDQLSPILATARNIEIDTLLLSVGLIPENELSKGAGIALDPLTKGPFVDQYRETRIPGIFACGNVLHVHDLVDYVTEEAFIAGQGAARHMKHRGEEVKMPVKPVGEARYVIPQLIKLPVIGEIDFYLRVKKPLKKGLLEIKLDGNLLYCQRERFLKPAEMLRISVDLADLKNIAPNSSLSVGIKQI